MVPPTAWRVRLAAVGLAVLASCANHRQQVADPAPSGPGYLRDYKESYYRALGTRLRGHLHPDQMLDRIARTRVLYLGDHHRDEAWHARLEALLEGLHRRGVRLAFGLEAIGTQDGASVRGYLGGRYDLNELSARVRARWPRSWLDSQEVDRRFYRDLLQHARAWQAPVFALEPAPRMLLSARDDEIAGSVRRAAARWPDAVIVVVVGQAHLLGQGRLIERVALPNVALVPEPSVPLRRALQRYPLPDHDAYLETESRVFLPWHPTRGVIPRRGPSATS